MPPDFPQALLFDMDGLSVDTEPTWFEAESAIAASLGIEWTEVDQAYCLGGPIAKTAQRLADRGGVPHKWQEIGENLVDQVIGLLDSVKIKPGIEALIAQARAEGIPIALVSGSPRRVVDAVVASVPHTYDVIVSADDVERTKPAPDPYLAAAELLGVDITASLALEDSRTGMTSAEAANAAVLLVPEESIEPGRRRVVLSTLEGVTLEQIRELFSHDG